MQWSKSVFSPLLRQSPIETRRRLRRFGAANHATDGREEGRGESGSNADTERETEPKLMILSMPPIPSLFHPCWV